MAILLYGSETIIGREKERPRIIAAWIDSLKGLLSIRRVDRVTNAQIRKIWGVIKRVDEVID